MSVCLAGYMYRANIVHFYCHGLCWRVKRASITVIRFYFEAFCWCVKEPASPSETFPQQNRTEQLETTYQPHTPERAKPLVAGKQLILHTPTYNTTAHAPQQTTHISLSLPPRRFSPKNTAHCKQDSLELEAFSIPTAGARAQAAGPGRAGDGAVSPRATQRPCAIQGTTVQTAERPA